MTTYEVFYNTSPLYRYDVGVVKSLGLVVDHSAVIDWVWRAKPTPEDASIPELRVSVGCEGRNLGALFQDKFVMESIQAIAGIEWYGVEPEEQHRQALELLLVLGWVPWKSRYKP